MSRNKYDKTLMQQSASASTPVISVSGPFFFSLSSSCHACLLNKFPQLHLMLWTNFPLTVTIQAHTLWYCPLSKSLEVLSVHADSLSCTHKIREVPQLKKMQPRTVGLQFHKIKRSHSDSIMQGGVIRSHLQGWLGRHSMVRSQDQCEHMQQRILTHAPKSVNQISEQFC